MGSPMQWPSEGGQDAPRGSQPYAKRENYGGGGIPQPGSGPYAKRLSTEVGTSRNLGRDRTNHRFVVHELILYK